MPVSYTHLVGGGCRSDVERVAAGKALDAGELPAIQNGIERGVIAEVFGADVGQIDEIRDVEILAAIKRSREVAATFGERVFTVAVSYTHLPHLTPGE